MDDQLLGYILDALTPDEMAAVETHLAAHPADQVKLGRLRSLIAPLDADRINPTPPAGLAVAAIARVAEAIVADAQASGQESQKGNRPTPTGTPAHGLPIRRWVEVGLAASIAVVASGLILGGIQNTRRAAERAACAQHLRALSAGLSGYADTHDGHFPMVGTDRAPTAGDFVAVLADAGQMPVGLPTVCPAAPTVPAGYTYSLGYRTAAGAVIGPRRTPGLDDITPLVADLPSPAVAPVNGPMSPHPGGQLVLFAGGAVAFERVATVGPDGDDIYRNAVGVVKAGLYQRDVALGRAVDVP